MTNFALILTLGLLAAPAFAHADECDRSLGGPRDRTVEALQIAIEVTHDEEAQWVGPLVAKPGPPLIMLVGPGASRKGNLAKQIAGPVVGSRRVAIAAGSKETVARGMRELGMTLMMDDPTLIVLNVTLPPRYVPHWADASVARAELVKLGFDLETLYGLAGVFLIQE